MKAVITLPQFLRRKSSIFKHFPQLDHVTYCGVSNEKALVFSTVEGSRTGTMLLIPFIRQDESELWESCKDLFLNIFTSIEPTLHGIFRFDLLSIEMSDKLAAFQWKEFAKGMQDLTREIPLGESRFVQYCSILGVLRKHAYEDFGKIAFSPHLKVLQNTNDIAQDLGPIIREQQSEASSMAIYRIILYDLSRQELYSNCNPELPTQLQHTCLKLDSTLPSGIGEIFLIDNQGIHNIFQRKQLEMDFF